MIQLVIPFLLSTASISCSVINDAEPLTNGSISEILTMSSDGSMASTLPKAEFGQSLTPKKLYPVEQCTMEFVIEFEGSNLTNPVEIPVKLIQEGQEVTKLAKTILEGQNLVWTHRNDELFEVYRDPNVGTSAFVAIKDVNGIQKKVYMYMKFNYGMSKMSLEPDVKELRMCRKLVRADSGTAKRPLGSLVLWDAKHFIFNVTRNEKEGDLGPLTSIPSTEVRTTTPYADPPTTMVPPNNRERVAYVVIIVSSSLLFAMIFCVCFDGWRKNRKSENKAK